jgi:CheY-like chemotaxis protein
MLLEEGLAAQGLHVDCVENAEAAVALVRERPYDILLCDLNLSVAGGGKVNGRDVVEGILAVTGPDKPSVIFMTGDLVPDQPHSKSGDARLLQKPFRISDVMSLFKAVCSVRRLENVKR